MLFKKTLILINNAECVIQCNTRFIVFKNQGKVGYGTFLTNATDKLGGGCTEFYCETSSDF